jgi:hypothetical protein
MSEIKANKISPAIGTDVTMGDSGDTFTIPAGATIVNSGTATGFGGITKSASDPAVNENPAGGLGTVWLNTTSGEMYSLTDATAGANVWTNTGEGTGGVSPFNGTVATGGTITTDGNFKVHTFLDSGVFTVTTVGSTGIDYLAVAGGGGGGGAGGGGAGGILTSTGYSYTVSVQAYTVTIGAGAPSIPNNGQGSSGTNSVFGAFTLIGGGGGGGYGNPSIDNGIVGGSGGGGGFESSFTSQTAVGGAGTAGQGFAGGDNQTDTADPYAAAGGGGGGAVGDNCTVASQSGNGGIGLLSSINGTSLYYAGGGGGGSQWTGASHAGDGGLGGGGGGAKLTVSGSLGTAGTGGGSALNSGQDGQNSYTTGGDDPPAGGDGGENTGAGGGGMGISVGHGGAGGSGVVIIRYQFQ